MTKIISVVNQKGGTGKTTSAINVASCLAQKGLSCLVLDVEPQANATLCLGIDPLELSKAMYEVLLNEATLEEIILDTNIKNLKIAPAQVSLANTDINLADEPENQFKLKKKLSSLKENFDYIIIDCPPSLSLLTINALSASDEVLIPILADYLSLEGLIQLSDTIERVRKNLNPHLRILGILICMADYRMSITRESIDLVRKHFRELVFDSEVGVSVKLKEAPSFGKSVFEYAPRSSGAESYRKVTEEMLNKIRS